MLSKFRFKFNKFNKHQQYLAQLPKLSQPILGVVTLYSPSEFFNALITAISEAKKRICITALYLENDTAGLRIMKALYAARQAHPKLDISILVDWHRAKRARIGSKIDCLTNAEWYSEIASQHPDIVIPIYGIPINIHEAFGILHLKGFIIDNKLLYSGANLNNVYLHQYDTYRLDRYQIICNSQLTDIMYEWICKIIKQPNVNNRLDQLTTPSSCSFIKNKTRQFREALRNCNYQFVGNTGNEELAVTPLVGLGKHSLLNKTIINLIICTKYQLTFCTPYFNPPAILIRNFIYLLRQGKKVEIIVGDKTANDFYIPLDQKFELIGVLPYLYEINLRKFINRLQYYISNNQLIIRVWKHKNNSYHLKGIWVDDKWMMITGNNLNPRAWRFDLENAILIHDPLKELTEQREKELKSIHNHTIVIHHVSEIERITDYPIKVRKLIKLLRRIRIDRLISQLI
ncbi:CDP-diacylglycerol--serine O-phosphatidyltransferase [Pantoea sp. Mhis]|nr:CDP-diacylglycerol--serine O-phosphatidyltransferase [Pantoea sp. Mhis]